MKGNYVSYTDKIKTNNKEGKKDSTFNHLSFSIFLVIINIITFILFYNGSTEYSTFQKCFLYSLIVLEIFLATINYLYFFFHKDDYKNYGKYFKYLYLINLNISFFIPLNIISKEIIYYDQLKSTLIYSIIFSNILLIAVFEKLVKSFKEILISVIILFILSIIITFLLKKQIVDTISIIYEELSKIFFYLFLLTLYYKFSNLKKVKKLLIYIEILEKTVNFLMANQINGFLLYKSNSPNIKNEIPYFDCVYSQFISNDNLINNILLRQLNIYFNEKNELKKEKVGYNPPNAKNENQKINLPENITIRLKTRMENKNNTILRSLKTNVKRSYSEKVLEQKKFLTRNDCKDNTLEYLNKGSFIEDNKAINKKASQTMLEPKVPNFVNNFPSTSEIQTIIKEENKQNISEILKNKFLSILENFNYNNLIIRDDFLNRFFNFFGEYKNKVKISDFTNFLFKLDEFVQDENEEIGPLLLNYENDDKKITEKYLISIKIKKLNSSENKFYFALIKYLDINFINKTCNCPKNREDQIDEIVPNLIEDDKENSSHYESEKTIIIDKKISNKIKDENELESNEPIELPKKKYLPKESTLTVLTKDLKDLVLTKDLANLILFPTRSDSSKVNGTNSTSDPKIAALLHDFKNVVYDFTCNISLLVDKIGQGKMNLFTTEDISYLKVLESYILTLIKMLTDYINKKDFLLNNNASEIDLISIIRLMETIFKRRLEYENLNKEIQFIKNIEIKTEIDHELNNNIMKKMNLYNKDLVISLLYNIISNSYKYTNLGQIKIELKFEKVNNQIMIIVEDTGKGIPQSILKNWGKPFNNIDNEKGSGLGQFIILNIASSLGLFIPKPESNNKGTKIRIYFPLIHDKIESKQIKLSSNKITSEFRDTIYSNKIVEPIDFLHNVYILCLDDCQIILNSFEKILNDYTGKKNYNLILKKASNFNEFFFEINSFLMFDSHFDFLILDQNLNGPLSGIDCAEFTMKLYKRAIQDFNEENCFIFFMTEEINFFENHYLQFPDLLKKEKIFNKNEKKIVINKILDIIENRDK